MNSAQIQWIMLCDGCCCFIPASQWKKWRVNMAKTDECEFVLILPKFKPMWPVGQPNPLFTSSSEDLCSNLSISFKFDWYLLAVKSGKWSFLFVKHETHKWNDFFWPNKKREKIQNEKKRKNKKKKRKDSVFFFWRKKFF